MVGHGWPDASDEYLLLGHGRHQFPSRPFGVQHEAIADRWNIGEVMFVEKSEGVLANLLERFAALWNQVLRLQTRGSADHARHRHHAGPSRTKLGQQVG